MLEPIPWLEPGEIRRRADAFLDAHHPSGRIPIPIEEIVEFRLGLDIVPMPGLRGVLEVDGFTTGDGKAIFVDEAVYGRFENRYRFTLAHEVGHLVLHPQIFAAERGGTIEERRRFVSSIPEDVNSRLEWQAHAFAGHLLVPSGPLAAAVRETRDRVRSEEASKGVSEAFLEDLVEAVVAREFGVSAEVLHRRAEAEGLRRR